MPRWDGKLWAGDSAEQALVRAQDPNPATSRIPASDPRFNDYIAMSYEDFRSFYATYVEGCAAWKSGVDMMTPQQAEDVFKVVLDQYNTTLSAKPVHR